MDNVAKTQNAYGLLFTLDGYDADRSRCADPDLLLHLLQDLPLRIGMRPLGEPHIESVYETGIAGLSGFTFIIESHISIHTYQERGFVTADIYSCKQFNTNAVKIYLMSMFAIKHAETHTHLRGLQFNDPTMLASLRPPE